MLLQLQVMTFTVLDGTRFNVENIAMSIGKPLVIKAISVTHPTVTQFNNNSA